VGNIPIHRIAGLQEACVISNIWSFFPKPMKSGLGPTCEEHFAQFPENPQTQMRGEDTLGLEQASLIYMLKSVLF
jgi:hypothetical protein